jgi:hypothetical protein
MLYRFVLMHHLIVQMIPFETDDALEQSGFRWNQICLLSF